MTKPHMTTRTPAFENLAVGAVLPGLVRGPLLEPHLMRWSAAIENWHRIHYDQKFAVEHNGLPGLVINGSWKQHFLVQVVREWAEPDGWLRHISFQFRALDLVGSTLKAWGQIAELTEEDGCGIVRLTIGIPNQDGQESTPGTAEVVLPLAGSAPVPYPYPQPGVQS